MWVESSLSPPGFCEVPYFPFTLGCCVPYLLRQTSVSLRHALCVSALGAGMSLRVGKKKHKSIQSKIVPSFPEQV